LSSCLRGSERRQPGLERRINQFRHELLTRARRVAPVRHAAQADEITCERRRRASHRGRLLAQPRRGINERERDSPWPRATPYAARGVEKLLQRYRTLVADVIN